MPDRKSSGGAVATTAASASPAHIVREYLSARPEVEEVFISEMSNNRIHIVTVIGEKNYDVQKRIFDAEAEIIAALPGIEVGFELVIREGRPVHQLLSRRGMLLFARR